MGDLGEAVGQGGVGHGVRARIELQGRAVGGHDRALRLGQLAGIEAELRGVVEGQAGQLDGRQGEGVGYRVAGDGDADGVGEGDAADPRAAQGREFGGDPAADRVADNGDVPQVEHVEQLGIDLGQGRDVGQPLGAARAVETGVDGVKTLSRTLLGQEAGERGEWSPGRRLRVQQQEGVPLLPEVDGDVEGALVERERVGAAGHAVLLWAAGRVEREGGCRHAKSVAGTVVAAHHRDGQLPVQLPGRPRSCSAGRGSTARTGRA